MISITTINYDRAGHVLIKPYPNSGTMVYQRRVSKNATLDGLSTISDFGFTFSDNNLVIKVSNLSDTVINRLLYFVQNYPLVRFASQDGVFIGSLNQVRLNIDPIEFNFDVKQQVA